MRASLVVVTTFLFLATAKAQYSGGTGEPEDPYLIYTAEQVNAIGAEPNDWDKHFRLMADIDLAGYAGTDYNIIAPYDADVPFTGVFDGNAHTIANFTYTSTDANSVALFGWVQGDNAGIMNLGLVDPRIEASARDGVAPLVDHLEDGTVSGCFVRGGSVSGGRWVGGLVAYNDGAIINCYSSAAVTGGVSAGGLVGTNGRSQTIRNSYSTGQVTGVEDVGGLLGSRDGYGTFTGCYWDVETSGQSSSAAGVGKTTTQLRSAVTFIGWSADAAWTIDEGNDYPRLASEGMPGVLLAPPTPPACATDVGAFEIAPSYGGGTGEPNDPYLIYTPEQMHRLGAEPNDWSKHFRLMADIDLKCTGMVIGDYNDWEDNRPFTGVFDGNGHTITNLRLGLPSGENIGLFGYVQDPNARIMNVGLINPLVVVLDGGTVGLLVGRNGGTVADCYAEGGMVDGASSVGALVGLNSGTVARCRTSVTVTGTEHVGGMVGQNDGDVTQCLNTGDVSGDYDVGGLVGENEGEVAQSYSLGDASGLYRVGGLVGENEGEITESYSLAGVSGLSAVGGLVGANIDTCKPEDYWPGPFQWCSTGHVSQCYSAGVVSGDTDVGGLVGWNDASVANSFWDMETSGQMTSAGGTGKTTAEMQTIETFRIWRICALGGIWTVDEGQDYPRLWWEDRPGSPIDPILLSQYIEGTGTADDPYQIHTAADLDAIAQFPCEQGKTFRLAFLDGEGTQENPYLIYTAEEIDILDMCPYEQDAHYRLMFVAGEGTAESPYLIETAEQFDLIGMAPYEWDAHYELAADIDLSGYVGTSFHIIHSFKGIFDGKGHTVSNFTYVRSDRRHFVGLIGGVSDAGAEIKNLRLVDPNVAVEGGGEIGALVGCLEQGLVTDCHVEGGRIAGGSMVGGLVGGSYDTLERCSSTASVTGTWGVGGLVGHNNGPIVSCCAFGDVAGGELAGGLVGRNWQKGLIKYSYAMGSVTGEESTGGLVGSNAGAAINCYCTGPAAGGGFAGENTGGIFISFWDVETSGVTASAGGIGATTAEMHMASTFFAWGCETAWTIDEDNDYPRLLWENAPGALIEGCLWQGDGTEANPYLIHTAAELTAISEVPFVWGRHFRLVADVDLNASQPLNAIGLSKQPFTGIFDGDGHTIFNLRLSRSESEHIGLFGYVTDRNAEIKNLVLADPNVQGESSVGALVGYLSRGTVSRCYVENGSVQGGSYLGMLVGYLGQGTVSHCRVDGGSVRGGSGGGLVGSSRGTIVHCHATSDVFVEHGAGGITAASREGDIVNCSATEGTIRGTESVGGLVGYVEKGRISGCYSSNRVETADPTFISRIGGFVGSNHGMIENCYSTSTVTDHSDPGDLWGQMAHWCAGGFTGDGGTGRNCYSTGVVTGNYIVGGFRGQGIGSGSSSCFWDIESSGVLESAGGTGLTTAEMQTASTFLDAGWDFIDETENGTDDIWWILEGQDYPRLWWELLEEGDATEAIEN